MTQPPDKTLELIERLVRKLRGIAEMLPTAPAEDLNEAADLLASHHAAANELGYENFNAMVAGVRAMRAAMELMPDYIEVFRLIRATTGSKHAAYAKAVADRIEEIKRAAITNRSAT